MWGGGGGGGGGGEGEGGEIFVIVHFIRKVVFIESKSQTQRKEYYK